MPHPRVAEMRRRLEKIMKLADRAASRAGWDRVEALLVKWEREEMTTEQLTAELKKLAGRE